MTKLLLIGAGAALLLAGCASGPSGVEVTRFHLSQPLTGQTISVVPPPGTDAGSLQFQSWASSIAAELGRAGFQPVAAGQSAALTATARIDTQTSTQQRQSPFSVGIGGGTTRGNVGIGGSVSTPVGRGRTTTSVLTSLNLQIRRSGDNAVQWEGRASQSVSPGEVNATVGRLARAMLTGFPGASGQTVTIRPAA